MIDERCAWIENFIPNVNYGKKKSPLAADFLFYVF